MTLRHFVACCLLAALPAAAEDARAVLVTAAFQVPNAAGEATRPEGNAEINAAKAANPDLGSTLTLYLQNRSAGSRAVRDVAWDGAGLEARAGKPDYQVIWWRLLPNPIPPGGEGEVAVCLRRRLAQPVDLLVTLDDGSTARARVAPEPPPFRLGTLAFDEGLRSAVLVVEAADGQSGPPDRLFLDGVELRREVRWLSPGFAAGVRTAVVTPRAPFQRGRAYTFRATAGTHSTGATIRAFTDLARFGTYGYGDVQRYAESGVNAYASFGSLKKESLDRAQAVGVRSVATVRIDGTPPAETAGHPALLGYFIGDEPDCRDYKADEERPMHLRIGTVAQRVANTVDTCIRADPLTPVRVTVDLTFTPYNYFVYGPIPDVLNPDCYPVSIGWPIRAVREKAAVAKRAAAPRPFTFTFQGCWEEYAIKQPEWISRAAVSRIGRDALVDPKRVRGLGRAPTPAEVRMQMLYAIGCGARGLFSYTDATEGGGDLLFHSSAELPEVWHEIGRTTRALRLVAPLIELAHPVVWATADAPKLWVRTLLCGDRGALVAVVNEECESAKERFTQTPARKVTLRIPDLPWLAGREVLRVEDGDFARLPSRREGSALVWTEPEIADAALYLVPAGAKLPAELEARARREVPVATPAGKQPGPESYLKGRRSRWSGE